MRPNKWAAGLGRGWAGPHPSFPWCPIGAITEDVGSHSSASEALPTSPHDSPVPPAAHPFPAALFKGQAWGSALLPRGLRARRREVSRQ